MNSNVVRFDRRNARLDASERRLQRLEDPGELWMQRAPRIYVQAISLKLSLVPAAVQRSPEARRLRQRLERFDAFLRTPKYELAELDDEAGIVTSALASLARVHDCWIEDPGLIELFESLRRRRRAKPKQR